MFFKRFLIALSYVTSLPTGKKHLYAGISRDGQPDPDLLSGLSGLAPYLPAVGLVIGLLLLALNLALQAIASSPSMASIILTITWLCLTGGLHFDGLMDTADGIFCHQSQERMLEIMSDSRVGNFGVLAGVVVFLLKATALFNLVQHQPLILAALILIPAWGRYCELYAIGQFPYAKKEGKGKVFHQSTRKIDMAYGAIVPITGSLAVAMFAGALPVVLVTGATIIAGFVASHWLFHHLKGQTGDTYGAIVELSETGGLVAAALLAGYVPL
ncbi:MAG: adenosylcobinamide-GDP ribazoletransferase [Candidatus Obscuribacterales bacterium]|nr:adenosylcobinamide-GDP ribazoletransferase [Candidatus Obscuribacterales bacterium]